MTIIRRVTSARSKCCRQSKGIVSAFLLGWISSASGACFDRTGYNYTLSWAAEGANFFDDWKFGETDYTGGAVRYVSRDTAHRENLTQAFQDYAIVRPGGIENTTRLQRKSVRLSTHKNWTYFVTAMRFHHTPYGCGVWPAFWSNGASGNWPTDGELDMMEYWNDAVSEVSFHTALSKADGCKLDKAQLRQKGCPQFEDVNNEFLPWQAYDCQTDYAKRPFPRLGCAPTSDQHRPLTGKQYAENPGIIAAEWTHGFIKVFYIPEAEIPEDLTEGNVPRPDTWDKWIISYYPFAASERAHPGTCNLTGQALVSPQSFVLNIELCGDRGSNSFPLSGCNSTLMCRRMEYARPGDCCYDYMTDAKKSSENIATKAFFNISWIKVWQQDGGAQS